MSDIIRKIRVPGGTVYDIVDQGARDLIDDVTEDAITGVSIDGDPVTVSNNTVNITSIPSGIVTNFKNIIIQDTAPSGAKENDIWLQPTH